MEDLTSFILHFLCESLESIPEFIDVTIGAFWYRVKLVVNFSIPYNLFLDQSSSFNNDLGDSEWEFWFGSTYHSQPHDPSHRHGSSSKDNPQKDGTPRLAHTLET